MAPKSKFVLTIVGLALVVAFWIGWVSTRPADTKAMAEFLSIHELLEEEQTSRIRLGGIVQPGSIVISDQNLLDVIFLLQEGDATIPVNYSKTRPDLFKDGAEVIVTGTYQGGVFLADELQTKCASRYEGDLREASSYNLDELNL